MSATDSIVVVPRWGGTPQDDWYPWIREQLGSRIEVLDMPRPETPTVEAWPAAIVDALALHPGGAVTLVGHSVGCQAILRALGQLPDAGRVRDVLCVAGWWAVDEPWETIRPWMESVPDLDRVRAAASFEVLLSTDDPFTADYEENGRLWKERVGARVTVVPNAKHFNAAQEPVVLDQLKRP